MGSLFGKKKSSSLLDLFIGDRGFPGGASGAKNLPMQKTDASSFPESGLSPERDSDSHSSVLPWRIHGQKKPGGLYSL